MSDAIEEKNPMFIRGTKRVAKVLGVHERTVTRWIKAHVIPYTKVGGALIFRMSDLEKTFDRMTIPSVLDVKRRTRRTRKTAGGGAA